jgi:vacuolar protein sorting-associated protein IST1
MSLQVKLKSTLRLLIPRLRNAQQKDTALSVAARREMADLLATNRESSARIRVENIIHTDVTVELMEILELYAELLLARAGLLDVRDKNVKDGITSGASDETGLEEAAASIIYAAPRLPREVRELGLVRGMLIERFGKEFAVKANENEGNIVPNRVAEKLKVEPPSAKLVQAYLEEIARSYGVDWPKGRREEEMAALSREVDDEDDSDGVGGGMKEAPILADGTTRTESKTPDPKGKGAKLNLGNLRDATPPTGLGGGAKSPVSVAPPGARSDNLSPSVKLPGGGQVKKGSEGTPTKKASGGDVVGGKVPTVDDLAKRFQALKR